MTGKAVRMAATLGLMADVCAAGEPLPLETDNDRGIPGRSEALPMMKEGARWARYIPADLAYGERGARARMPPNSALIFEVELIKVQ